MNVPTRNRPQKPSQTLSDAELAEFLGFSTEEIAALAAAGCPREASGRWKTDAVAAWLHAHTAPMAPKDDLAERIRAARGPGDLAKIGTEVAALASAGRMMPARALAVQRLLAEARHQWAAAPTETSADDVIVTIEALELVRIFEGIVSGERRKAVLACARENAVADERQFDRTVVTDPAAFGARLKEAGLDAWGDSVRE